MAGQSAAQPFVDLRDKIALAGRRISAYDQQQNARPTAVDDAYHRDALARANQSFRDAAVRDAAARDAAARDAAARGAAAASTPIRTPVRASIRAAKPRSTGRR